MPVVLPPDRFETHPVPVTSLRLRELRPTLPLPLTPLIGRDSRLRRSSLSFAVTVRVS